MKKLFIRVFLLLSGASVIEFLPVSAMDELNIIGNPRKRLLNEIVLDEDTSLFPVLKKMKLPETEPVEAINLTTLPYDCMSLIMGYLPFQDLGRLFISCRSLHSTVLDKMKEFKSINSSGQSCNLEISLSYKRTGGIGVILQEIDMFRFISKHALPESITTADLSMFSCLCLPSLKGMPLTSLAIDFSDRTEYISELKGFPMLTKLNLRYIDAEDATLDGLEELSNLTSLTLSSCHPSENPQSYTDISVIQDLPNLKELILQEAWFATNFSDLRFNKLEILIIDESTPNYDEAINFRAICNNIPTLKYFKTRSIHEAEYTWK